jgi:hypothetical protein
VFVSKNERSRLLRLFEGLDSDLMLYDQRKRMYGIDYELLKDGDPYGVRFVLGEVIMDTMSDESTEDLDEPTEDAAVTIKTVAKDLDEGSHLHCPDHFNHREAAVVANWNKLVSPL